MVGGGSLPEESLSTKLVAIPGTGAALEALAKRLRLGDPPIIARIEDNRLLLDPRTVDPREDSALIRAVKAALRG
jgi:L-seryl-tRNA(Ser) seleniumtransferase